MSRKASHYSSPSASTLPMPTVDLVHPINCDCALCESFRVPDPSGHLSARHKGMLATLGAVVGSAIAFGIDPARAADALRATIGF